MKNRFWILLLAAIMVLGLAAGCAPSNTTPSNTAPSGQSDGNAPAPAPATEAGKQKITVLLPKHEMDTIGLYEEETRKFEQETGIQVELINMSWDNVADRVIAELTAGGSSYDVIEFDNAWLAKFSANDWLEPLDGFDGVDAVKAGVLPGLVAKFSMSGKFYGVAWNNDTRFFMYNKALLDQTGITKAPETWPELVDASKKMKEQGLIKYGYIDAYLQGQAGANEYTYIVYSFGGKFIDENGNPCMGTDPKTKAAYEFLVSALDTEKVIDPASLTSDYENAANVFYMGDTAFFVQAWPGVYSDANDSGVSSIVGQVAVADYAIHAPGESQVVLTLPEAMAIPKTSKNKEAAWKYIQHMTSKEFDKKKGLTIGALPVWSELYTDSELLALYPYWEQFGKQAEFAVGHPDLLWYDEYANILTMESQRILLGQVSVDEGLKSMQEQCEKVKK